MAKTVSGKLFCKALERKGWVKLKTKGGHQKYSRPQGGEPVIVPVHGSRDLKRGLLERLLEQTGLTLDDLCAPASPNDAGRVPLAEARPLALA